MLLFSNLNEMLFGYFDPEKIPLIIKINDFWGALTDVSAKKNHWSERDTYVVVAFVSIGFVCTLL